MNFCQAMDVVRPGFAYGEAMGGDPDDVSVVRVVGERGNRVLLRGGESPGWWGRAEIAELIVGASAQQSLRSRLRSAPAGAAGRAVRSAPSA